MSAEVERLEAVAAVVSHAGGVGWLRPELCEVGDQLCRLTEAQSIIAQRDARIAELELAVADYREQLPAGLLRRIASVNPDSTRPETCGVVVPRPLLENCASYMEGSASPTVASWHKSICALLLTPRAQQPSAGVEDEREAFEAWYSEHYYEGDESCTRQWLFREPCGNYRHEHASRDWRTWQARARLNPCRAQAVADDAYDWSVFPGYLIDHCEGHEVAEESLQGWLSEMFTDPHYGALFRREKTADGQPVNHSLPITTAIEAAEEEHGGLRAAAKALGIDPGYLSRLKSAEKVNPSDEVLSALGLERVTIYRAAQQKESE